MYQRKLLRMRLIKSFKFRQKCKIARKLKFDSQLKEKEKYHQIEMFLNTFSRNACL